MNLGFSKPNLQCFFISKPLGYLMHPLKGVLRVFFRYCTYLLLFEKVASDIWHMFPMKMEQVESAKFGYDVPLTNISFNVIRQFTGDTLEFQNIPEHWHICP